jgi:PIN domain nuclease of toxin-antitoxin system
MTSAVLDASAVIALLMGEPGGAAVQAVLGDCAMSTVNFAEVVAYATRLRRPEREIRGMLESLSIERIDFDVELAYQAGLLEPATRPAGLSLGDRACLALAHRLRARAVTTDRAWRSVSGAVGVEIEVIR